MSTDVHKIYFDFETMSWKGITVDMVKRWEKAYPDLDVVDILTNKMPIWLESNPEKAKKTRWKRFITNWLSKQQGEYDKIKFMGRR